MRVELTRYFYHRYLKPARLPFRHFRIFNFGLCFVKTQAVVFAQVSEPSASATTTPKIFLFLGDPGFATSAYLILVCASSKHKPLFLRRFLNPARLPLPPQKYFYFWGTPVSPLPHI